ncbi:PTS transporter subunit EIIC [Aerococcus kribbianus]|uniref:PTS transporter subunit EIIC n=1 Tax=Aerococcus kribbianus TaxID=2999064 RepID=A0A9X3JFB2_9LACT|nr:MULTISPECIES: PTS transporter subunit EIIC [unclassified Aerococcus]MCZ0717438.1 PTS transporter subunit EIIC [Aerococcus sp. YH-aer221]MCZ0725726.1 PTS transporter subunit EIIC [Aerococcus sp. YH-aer222]
MTNSNEKRLAAEIYAAIGGPENTNKVYNCMTRVRIEVKNDQAVDLEQLRSLQGVLGVVEDDTLQVVVGPGKAAKIANEMAASSGVSQGESIDENLDQDLLSGRSQAEQLAAQNKAQQHKRNDTPFKRALKVIASIFVPLIPAFVGAGIIGGLASIIENLMTAGTIDPAAWTNLFTILKILQSGLFAYLNIYIGINAARVFGATDGLGGVVAGVTYLTGMAPENPLPNIFTGGELAPGQGGVIGVIIAVYLLSLVEKALRKVVPDAIDIIVTPTLSLLFVGIVTIFLIMPVAGFISSSLVGAINWVLAVGGAFAGFILGASFLPLVMFGLHQILTPIHIEMIASSGKTVLLPILAMAGAGQVGAALALWMKCRKNKQLTNIIKGSLPVGILGIGEPLIYAVTLPLGRPFITACLGGGVGGAILGAIGGVGATAIGPSGLALIPLVADGQWLAYVLGLLAAYLGGFILTYFFGVPKEAQEASEITGAPSNTMDALDEL